MGFGVIVAYPKRQVNIGTLWRSAFCFGASFLATVGRRYAEQSSDTTAAWRHLPLVHYATWDDCRAHLPFGWWPIAVEVTHEARSLVGFLHPKCAVYLFGPEDGALDRAIIGWSKTVVQIPSLYCLNLSVAGAIVMYDRVSKERTGHALP